MHIQMLLGFMLVDFLLRKYGRPIRGKALFDAARVTQNVNFISAVVLNLSAMKSETFVSGCPKFGQTPCRLNLGFNSLGTLALGRRVQVIIEEFSLVCKEIPAVRLDQFAEELRIDD